MRYLNCTDKEYKGLDITIYEREPEFSIGNVFFTVDVKKPCGELVYGWESKPSFNCAMMAAVDFIDCMEHRGY